MRDLFLFRPDVREWAEASGRRKEWLTEETCFPAGFDFGVDNPRLSSDSDEGDVDPGVEKPIIGD